MTGLAFPRRPLSLAVVLMVAAACGDGVGPLRNVPGYYRLIAINGQPLPYLSPPSMGGSLVAISRGDLVLRANGTFAHGLAGNVSLGVVEEGTYRLSDGEVSLRWDGSPIGSEMRGQVSRDSISLAWPDVYGQPMTWIYRRTSPPPSSLSSGRYRLRSINGRTDEPLISYDTTIAGWRYVGSVLFDSLEFTDGVFFRQHRSQSAIAYPPSGLPIANAQEWTTGGAYESRPGGVVLMYYGPPPPFPARDSLLIAGDTLIRRTSLVTGVQLQRYVPVR